MRSGGRSMGGVILILALAFGLAMGLGGEARAEGPARYWVTWKPTTPKAGDRSSLALSPRAAQRLERLGRTAGADARDYAVPHSALAPIIERGLPIRRISRFLQAASVEMTPDQAREIARDPRVLAVRPVAHFVRPLEPDEASLSLPGPELQRRGAALDTDPRTLIAEDYGASWDQLAMLGVQELHERGYSGEGVLVAVFDTGFYKVHESLSGLDLVAEHDFVCDDDEVQWLPGDACGVARANDHGTYTWSTLGGFAPGNLIGPAFRAGFVLAKTEDVSREVHQEEDNYIAALEWADSLGVDVVSSSLGYRAFDDGSEYTVAQLDGRTAPITVATDLAADRGIVVVTAMGNEGPGESTLGVPADGRRVVSVGAVDMRRMLAYFSSWGPTGDGRIKPDVVALGVGTACGASAGPHVYARVNGTSLSTPLAAGLAALLVEAEPTWGPDSIASAMRRSGDRREAPTNTMGWGVPDGVRALRIPDARPQVIGVAWADSSVGGDGNGIPGWGESATLSIWVRNIGREPAGASTLWPARHDARLSLSDSATVVVPPLAAGDSSLVPLGRVIVGGGEGQEELSILVHFAFDGREVDRRVDLPVLPARLVAGFEAEADEAGAVRLSWRLASTSVVGVQIYRKIGTQGRTLLTETPLDPTVRSYTDRPGTFGDLKYTLEVMLVGGFLSREGPYPISIPEPQRVLVGLPYPNPANAASIAIPLAWPRADAPTVQVYTVSGSRCVRNLTAPAGGGDYPSLLWDLEDDQGHEVPSGVYFVKAPGGSTRRVIVVR